jgi:hypothetical protein
MRTLVALVLLLSPVVASAGHYQIYDTRGNAKWGNSTRYGGTVYDSRGAAGWYWSTPHAQGVMTAPWERERPPASRFVPLNRLGW